MVCATRTIGLWAAALTVPLLLASAAFAEDPSTDLRYSTALKAATPAELTGGGQTFRGEQGTLSLGSDSVAIGVRKVGANLFFGVDADGDGEMDRREWHGLGKDFLAAAEVKRGGRKYALKFTVLRAVAGDAGKIASVTYRANAGFAYAGRLGGTAVQIVDDNLDGKITQDGKDALVVGTARTAVPLRSVHRIGSAVYRLTVEGDGSKLTAAPLDEPLAIVKVPFRSKMMQGLVIENATGAFELTEDGDAGIPAGEYKLVYGLLGGSSQQLVLKPTKLSTAWTVKAGHENTIRVGPPLAVFFDAQLVGSDIKVSPMMEVIGSGGELYDMNFNTGRPAILLLQGAKTLVKAAMGYG